MYLKNKLYNVLVEKHSDIQNVYHGYVNADQEYHRKHRLKSWSLLLCLNIQHYLFGEVIGRTTSSNTAVRELSYPESQKQMSVDSLLEYMSEFDVVSFDVFDTLIFRACKKPSNLFSILGNRLEIVNYSAIRVEAEKSARAHSNKPYQEVNIYDIYEYVNLMCGLNQEDGIQAELQAEKDICFANPYMQQVLTGLQKKGKTVIAVSNMYLPKEMIQALLESCGYTCFTDKNIFVSCDLLCSKHRGILQGKVWDIVGRDKTVLHVGDNYNADFVGSRMAGWKSYYYKNVNESGANYRVNKHDSIELAIHGGLVNAKFHNGLQSYSSYYEVGYGYAGILALNYCKWINQFCRDHHIELLLFSGRDMYIVHKIYNLYFKEFDNEYMQISRFASMRFAFERFSEYFIEVHVKARAAIGKLSISEMLTELDISVLEKYLGEYHLSGETLFTQKEYPAVKQCIYDHKQELLRLFEPERKAALSYYKALIKNRKRIAVVDLGWQGTNSLCLKHLLETYESDIEVYSLLMGAMGRAYVNESISKGVSDVFCFSPQKNIDFKTNFSLHSLGRLLCELIFSSNEASLKCFAVSESGRIVSELITHEVRNTKQLDDIHQGILNYAEDIAKLGIEPDEMQPSGYESLLPLAELSRQKNFVSSMLQENEVNLWIGIPTHQSAAQISKNMR